MLNAVIDYEHLASARHLEVDGVAHRILAKGLDNGLDGLPISRGRCQDAEIPGPHERELQSSGDGRGGERERVDVDLQLPQLLLDADPEALLLVNDKQPEILELDIFANEAVSPDDDIDIALREPLDDGTHLCGLAKSRNILDLARQPFETVTESVIVLEGEDCGRDEHRHLLAVAHGLESGADGQLRLAKPDVSADEAVHRRLTLHVGLDGLVGLILVGRVLIEERRLELLLHIRVGRKGVALLVLSLGV